jgi:hypothetical protein
MIVTLNSWSKHFSGNRDELSASHQRNILRMHLNGLRIEPSNPYQMTAPEAKFNVRPVVFSALLSCGLN